MTRTRRQTPATLRLGLALLLVVIVVAAVAPLVITSDPTALDPINRIQPPSAQAWFGTDLLGRDVFARTIHGARVSLLAGISVALIATASGALIGFLATSHRWLDLALMRMMDAMMAIPPLLLAIALMTLWRGGSVTIVIVAISLAEMPRVARVTRALVLGLRQQTFVLAAVACGRHPFGIVRAHLLPNMRGPLTVQATLIFASAMIAEAVLGFIGAGVPPAIPSWGNIMSEGRALWQIAPGVVFFPAAMLTTAVLAVCLISDGLTSSQR